MKRWLFRLSCLRYAPERWAANYLMRKERQEIGGSCHFSRMEITDSDQGVRLEVVAWDTTQIVRGDQSGRRKGCCVCGVVIDPMHRDGGRCVYCGRDIEPGWAA